MNHTELNRTSIHNEDILYYAHFIIKWQAYKTSTAE